ncbi:hypothetical protein M2306_001779 [Myroides gitamensis]|nr:hypothetical protein [Myroides odoratus]MDH6601085.1 hypothetical protein [Myroides gitamensis]
MSSFNSIYCSELPFTPTLILKNKKIHPVCPEERRVPYSAHTTMLCEVRFLLFVRFAHTISSSHHHTFYLTNFILVFVFDESTLRFDFTTSSSHRHTFSSPHLLIATPSHHLTTSSSHCHTLSPFHSPGRL